MKDVDGTPEAEVFFTEDARRRGYLHPDASGRVRGMARYYRDNGMVPPHEEKVPPYELTGLDLDEIGDCE